MRLRSMMILPLMLFLRVLGLLALFQLMLVPGAPMGSFSWGGRHQVLPSRTRVGSALAILIYALFAMVALDRAGIIHSFPGTGFSIAAMRVIAAFLVLSMVQNLFSKSSHERLAMTPVVIFRENQ